MKKFGKYEKQPVEATQKPQKQKNPLLQTYLTSMLSLLLCVAMFFGTSYAWFTSEVENTQNEIYVGTLKVGLNKVTAVDNGEQIDSLNSTTSEVKLFDKEIRWEPGYTSLETIEVVNQGDLAFNYVLYFTEYVDETATAAEAEEMSIEQIAKNFEVWSYAHGTSGAPDETDYLQLGEENSGWTRAGTLEEVLKGEAVLFGEMNKVRDEEQNIVNTKNRHTIALHMKEDASADVMGKKVMLNVKLVAYQKAAEADGFGNTAYGKMVVTEEALVEAFQNGGVVALAADIELKDSSLVVPADKNVVLDLNGHTIYQTKNCTADYQMINNNGTLTINDTSKNGTGKIILTDTGDGDPNRAWGSTTVCNNGTLVINGGSIVCEHENTAAHRSLALDQYTGSTTINGGKITNTSYHAVRLWKGTLTINGGSFQGRIHASCVDEHSVLNITSGTFTPNGAEPYAVFVDNGTVNNSTYYATLAIKGGTFYGGIGCNAVTEHLKDVITGGIFEGAAMTNTDKYLFADN